MPAVAARVLHNRLEDALGQVGVHADANRRSGPFHFDRELALGGQPSAVADDTLGDRKGIRGPVSRGRLLPGSRQERVHRARELLSVSLDGLEGRTVFLPGPLPA
jgi:hypothetical protein